MWEKIIAKLAQSVIYQKIKAWLVESGLANLLYLAIGLGVWVVPIVPAVLKSHISVGALSIFVYLNWNVIRKLWRKDKSEL